MALEYDGALLERSDRRHEMMVCLMRANEGNPRESFKTKGCLTKAALIKWSGR